MKNRYYCLYRPPMLGAVPRGFCTMEDFGERRYVPEIGREAWGWVEYEKPLYDEQVFNYELVAAPEGNAANAGKRKTWKQAKIHDMQVRFGGCVESYRGYDDDRLIYVNTYEQIMTALRQLPDDPVCYLRVAMWRQIRRDIPLLEGIQARFCD